VGVPVGRKLLTSAWGGRAKVQPETATKMGRQGTSTRKDLHVLCYEHHAEMLLEYRSKPAETFVYACREPGCFITTRARKGTSSSPKMGRERAGNQAWRSLSEGWRVMYLAEVRPKERVSAYGNARNVTRYALMGKFQVRQPLPANAVSNFFRQVL